MSLHVFGIRHHGPGCARALRSALEALSPDVLLVEGPPDAAEALSLAGDPGLVPPVALLVHAVDDPRRSFFYPFAEFSPEWQALRFAAARSVPVRFMDLPCAHQLAEAPTEPDDDTNADDDSHADGIEPDDDDETLREDPIGLLAEAAGFVDREQWWDVQVEQRKDAKGLFEGILEAMTELRSQHEDQRPRELRREAHMRTVIRAAEHEGHERIAIVCGAWHAPRLATLGPAKADAALLKGLPRTKVAATWIPWTYSRLGFRSGYGAGVDSPGWYAHLFAHEDGAPVVWATRAARLLREQDLDASSANVIETVRLATTLASLRELPAPGLGELREAILSTLCGGERARLGVIRSRLEIGDSLGQVPEQAGQVPLMRDFEKETKRLRLKPSAEQSSLELDLRKETDRDRSHLLHRLQVLGVGWATPLGTSKGAGTFREGWRLVWNPELAVALIAANLHGNTVQAASTSSLRERATAAALPELTKLVEVALLAGLDGALESLLAELDARAATSSDVLAQMQSLEPLARVARYGDVRGTRAEHVLPVLRAVFERVIVGLLPACTQVDDASAAELTGGLARAHGACLLLDEAALKEDWLGALRRLADGGAAHPRVRGRACRLLLAQQALTEQELAERASLALSASVEPAHAAQWVEGLIAGQALLLVHQEGLLSTLDAWLSTLPDDTFQAQLPILRRAFSELKAAERRSIAQRLKSAASPGSPGSRRAVSAERFDETRVQLLLPVLARILGVDHG